MKEALCALRFATLIGRKEKQEENCININKYEFFKRLRTVFFKESATKIKSIRFFGIFEKIFFMLKMHK